jgi:hypothetical protein
LKNGRLTVRLAASKALTKSDMLRQTHTFVVLELSPAAYQEIEKKLKAAEYDHCFIKQDDRVVIDMHGIAVATEKQTETKKPL